MTLLTLHLGPQGTASSEVNATEEMSTLVNYVEPVKFKSFEAARSEWGGRLGVGASLALPDLTASYCPLLREEKVLRDVILCGDQGHGTADQEPHGVCGVSFGGTGATGPGRGHSEAGSDVLTPLRPPTQGSGAPAPLSGFWVGLGDCTGARPRSGAWGPRGHLEPRPGGGFTGLKAGLEAGGGRVHGVAPDYQPQIQQTAAQPHLPQGHPCGLIQLHAPALLERGLPARGTQLPDLGSALAHLDL